MISGEKDSMRKIYYSRAMDGLTAEEITHDASSVAYELSKRGMQIVDTLTETEINKGSTTLNKHGYRKIVENDLTLLKSADAVLMNLSIEGRTYIGCICELVYAHSWQIPIVVYVGSTGNEDRMWLTYHSKYICKSLGEALELLTTKVFSALPFLV